MAGKRKVANLLALALLAILVPGQPMHPYQMASALRRTGKERDMGIKWGSLYTVVQNMEKHGLIERAGSEREGRRPERTVYAITDAGRAEVRDWLRELVSVPEKETSQFEAALSVLGVLPPDEAAGLLGQRLHALDERKAQQSALIEQSRDVPRIFLVEAEFALAMTRAEAHWVSALLKEIREGTLPGVRQWREFHEKGQAAPEWQRMLAEE